MRINNNHISDNQGSTNIVYNKIHLKVKVIINEPTKDRNRSWFKGISSWIMNNALTLLKTISN